MINTNIKASSVNRVNAKVELYDGSTLVTTCTCDDRLQDFTVERVGQNNKFFGFGVFHKATINLIDLERNLTITEANTFKIHLGYGEPFVQPYPTFYANKVTRDETTNTITVEAYDRLFATSEAVVNDLALEAPYTIKDVANACGDILGLPEVLCGKNLWDNNNYITTVPDEYITKTETGFIFTRNDLTGGRAVHYSIPVKAGETYTFSYDITLTGEGARLIIYETEAYGTVLHQERDLSFITYTFEKDMIAVFSIILNSTVLTLDASKIQIEKSAAKTAYEPYLSAFDTSYPTGANFEGTENCKDVLNQIAEVTQTIYFLNTEDKLIFKRLDRDGLPVLTISKNDYYALESGDIRRLTTIVETNELGDSTSIEVKSVVGVTQYVRDNPFWELREDKQLLLTHAAAAIGGICAAPFHCTWDGNFLLEVGDKIALTTEDNNSITSYVLNDTIRYDSTLEEVTQFIHDGAEETASNPVSLGERLKQTYAKVDKQNKQIELVASESAANKSNIASLSLAVDGIGLAIESLENATIGDFTEITKRVVALELSDTEIKASVAENKTSVESVETNLSDLSKELSEAVVTVGVLNGAVEGHTASIGALTGTVNEHAESLGTLNGTVTTHTEKIGTLTTTTNEISGRVSNVETKTTNLTDDLGKTNAKVTENTAAIGELNVTTNSISASVSSVADRTTELETTTTALDGTVTSLSGKVTANETAIGELNVTTGEISASVASLESTTTELSSSLSDTDSKVETNTSDIASLKVTTEGITASVESLESTTESLTTKDGELEESITTNTEAIGELQVSTEEITASVSNLEETTNNLTGEVTTNKENIASLQITTEGISTSVSSLETNLNSKLDGLDESFESLAQEVSTKVTAQDIEVAITEERQKGAEKVTTSTGFTFDSEGLTITKSDSAISTNINEDGLSVFKYNEEVLTADNTGVQAQNLHATTYLIIGNNTYMADFTGTDGRDRAGCFWTGK